MSEPVWIIEFRACDSQYGWSDWSPTFDEDCGPYDTATGARRNCRTLERSGEMQHRVVRYERVGTKRRKGAR